MNYIDGRQENGIEYDYKKINKLFRTLKTPKEYYDPTTAPFGKAAWFVEVSQRSTGKTTNWLLYGLCMFWLYGTVIQYVRDREVSIAPKNMRTMFNIIIRYKYIDTLTDGKYNNVKYRAKKWYLVKTDENGEIVAESTDHFCYVTSVDRAGDLKSSYNSQTGDLIIYDEFIALNEFAGRCDFVDFCDLCKTILRDRLSGKIVLLANTINKEAQYFHELEIHERISEMNIGENCLHTTDGGTNVYVEIVGTPTTLKKRKKLYNKLFLGFKNPRLSGITGETTWSVKNYQHIPENEIAVISNKIYISHNNKLVRLQIVNNFELGVCVYLHWANKLYDDSIILTCGDLTDRRELYGLGDKTPLGTFLGKTLALKKWYFASNDVGSFVTNYLNQCANKTII